MSRRVTTAVGALLSATVLASGSAAAQPALHGAGIVQQDDVIIDEVGAELFTTASGGFVELHNRGDSDVHIGSWQLSVCNTSTFSSVTVPTGTVLKADEFYLFGDINYNGSGTAAPNQTLITVLEQDGGGALLEDAAFPRNVKGEVKWGTPESSCSGFPDAGVSPDSSNSIHFNTTPPPPWCKLPPAIGQSKSC